jgi:hypothetical protein
LATSSARISSQRRALHAAKKVAEAAILSACEDPRQFTAVRNLKRNYRGSLPKVRTQNDGVGEIFDNHETQRYVTSSPHLAISSGNIGEPPGRS